MMHCFWQKRLACAAVPFCVDFPVEPYDAQFMAGRGEKMHASLPADEWSQEN